jgi:hypothetical protein
MADHAFGFNPPYELLRTIRCGGRRKRLLGCIAAAPDGKKVQTNYVAQASSFLTKLPGNKMSVR